MSNANLNIKRLSSFLYELREWENTHLNISKSKICFDLFLFIAKNHYSGLSINSKTLHNSIDYSQRNIAYTVSKFKAWDLIYFEKNLIDKRIKNLHPTIKFCKLYEAYAEFINSNLTIELRQ